MEQAYRDAWIVEQQSARGNEEPKRHDDRVIRRIRHVNVTSNLIHVADVLVIAAMADAGMLAVLLGPDRIAVPNLG